MTINVINLNGNPIIEGLQLIESYRIGLVRKTINRYAHLIDGTAHIDLTQLATRIEKSERSLSASTHAHLLRTIDAEAFRHLNMMGAAA